jgi:hypothetical protein
MLTPFDVVAWDAMVSLLPGYASAEPRKPSLVLPWLSHRYDGSACGMPAHLEAPGDEIKRALIGNAPGTCSSFNGLWIVFGFGAF